MSEVRIPLLERDQVPPELAVVYDALLAQRGVVPNMFKTVAHVPPLALASGSTPTSDRSALTSGST